MDRNPSNEELRLAGLLDQFMKLSDDKDNAGRVIFRGPHGEYIGEATLSARDIEAATDALDSLNAYRTDMEEATRPVAPLPVDDSVTEAEMADVLAGFEQILNPKGGQQ